MVEAPKNQWSQPAGIHHVNPRRTGTEGGTMNILEMLEKEQMRVDIPAFRPGDTVRVHARIKEGEKERIQVFQGVVIRKRKGNTGASFTVRKISYGIGVERIFPLHSPSIEKIEVVTRGKVRRARLYYLRKLRGKAARIKEKRY